MTSTQSTGRNDDPEHIAAVAKMAEERGCDWPGHPCGRDIPEFNGRDAECICEQLVVTEASLEQIGRDVVDAYDRWQRDREERGA